MDIEAIRAYCLSLPHATEDIQWGSDLLFRVGGKMFSLVPLDASVPNRLLFQCTPEKFAELVERDGVIPAPYLARHNWVAIQSFDAVNKSEVKALIRQSYDLVLGKLPKKVRQGLPEKAKRRSKR